MALLSGEMTAEHRIAAVNRFRGTTDVPLPERPAPDVEQVNSACGCVDRLRYVTMLEWKT